MSCAFLLSQAQYKIARAVRPAPQNGEEGGGIWGGDDVLRFEILLYLSLFFNNSLILMDFQSVIEAILILIGIREVREYRKERKNNDNQRKDAENGKNHGSTR